MNEKIRELDPLMIDASELERRGITMGIAPTFRGRGRKGIKEKMEKISKFEAFSRVLTPFSDEENLKRYRMSFLGLKTESEDELQEYWRAKDPYEIKSKGMVKEFCRTSTPEEIMAKIYGTLEEKFKGSGAPQNVAMDLWFLSYVVFRKLFLDITPKLIDIAGDSPEKLRKFAGPLRRLIKSGQKTIGDLFFCFLAPYQKEHLEKIAMLSVRDLRNLLNRLMVLGGKDERTFGPAGELRPSFPCEGELCERIVGSIEENVKDIVEGAIKEALDEEERNLREGFSEGLAERSIKARVEMKMADVMREMKEKVKDIMEEMEKVERELEGDLTEKMKGSKNGFLNRLFLLFLEDIYSAGERERIKERFEKIVKGAIKRAFHLKRVVAVFDKVQDLQAINEGYDPAVFIKGEWTTRLCNVMRNANEMPNILSALLAFAVFFFNAISYRRFLRAVFSRFEEAENNVKAKAYFAFIVTCICYRDTGKDPNRVMGLLRFLAKIDRKLNTLMGKREREEKDEMDLEETMKDALERYVVRGEKDRDVDDIVDEITGEVMKEFIEYFGRKVEGEVEEYVDKLLGEIGSGSHELSFLRRFLVRWRNPRRRIPKLRIYNETWRKPLVFFLLGRTGTGKSMIVETMARKLGMTGESGFYVSLNIADINRANMGIPVAEEDVKSERVNGGGFMNIDRSFLGPSQLATKVSVKLADALDIVRKSCFGIFFFDEFNRIGDHGPFAKFLTILMGQDLRPDTMCGPYVAVFFAGNIAGEEGDYLLSLSRDLEAFAKRGVVHGVAVSAVDTMKYAEKFLEFVEGRTKLKLNIDPDEKRKVDVSRYIDEEMTQIGRDITAWIMHVFRAVNKHPTFFFIGSEPSAGISSSIDARRLTRHVFGPLIRFFLNGETKGTDILGGEGIGEDYAKYLGKLRSFLVYEILRVADRMAEEIANEGSIKEDAVDKAINRVKAELSGREGDVRTLEKFGQIALLSSPSFYVEAYSSEPNERVAENHNEFFRMCRLVKERPDDEELNKYVSGFRMIKEGASDRNDVKNMIALLSDLLYGEGGLVTLTAEWIVRGMAIDGTLTIKSAIERLEGMTEEVTKEGGIREKVHDEIKRALLSGVEGKDPSKDVAIRIAKKVEEFITERYPGVIAELEGDTGLYEGGIKRIPVFEDVFEVEYNVKEMVKRVKENVPFCRIDDAERKEVERRLAEAGEIKKQQTVRDMAIVYAIRESFLKTMLGIIDTVNGINVEPIDLFASIPVSECIEEIYHTGLGGHEGLGGLVFTVILPGIMGILPLTTFTPADRILCGNGYIIDRIIGNVLGMMDFISSTKEPSVDTVKVVKEVEDTEELEL